MAKDGMTYSSKEKERPVYMPGGVVDKSRNASLKQIYDNVKATCFGLASQGIEEVSIDDSRFTEALSILGLPDPRNREGREKILKLEQEAKENVSKFNLGG